MLQLIPYALQGASLLGGIFGKKRKHIDPEYLRQHFGPQAVAQDTTDLANFIINSPYGQQLLASAAEQGQGLQTALAAKAASAGLDPSSGGQSGASDFATAAGAQAQTGLERGTKAGIFQAAMPLAQQMVSDRQGAYLNDLYGGGYQTDAARTWQGIGNAAGFAASQMTPADKAPSNGPEVAGNGNGSIMTRTAGGYAPGADITPAGSALVGSNYLKNINARKLGMRMLGYGMVRPAQPSLSGYGFGG